MKNTNTTREEDTKQKDEWLKQLQPSAQSFINHFFNHDDGDQLSDKKVFERFQSALGSSFLPGSNAEPFEHTQALFEKSFNQWIFTLHRHAKLTPTQIETAYSALHYETLNLSTYSTDELAKLHAVLLEQYPEHYHSLLEDYNKILSDSMHEHSPIILDQKSSTTQPPTESNIAKLSIFMISKLLSLPGLPSPFLTASIIFEKRFPNGCELDIDDAFKFHTAEIISSEELSQLIKFSENIKDRSYIDKLEIFCELFIESLAITDTVLFFDAFVSDTKKYQLLMTILLILPLRSIKNIEFNLSDCVHNDFLSSMFLVENNFLPNESNTKDFIQCIGNNKLHWMLISLILCQSRPIESNHYDMSSLLEILHPLLKTVYEFNLEFKKLQKGHCITSHHFIVNTFELLNSVCRETTINEELFVDYCMIGKNHTLALTPMAALSEKCERLLKVYRSLCSKISIEQSAVLDFDKIKTQTQTDSNPFDLNIDASVYQEVTSSYHPTPMSISNNQESFCQYLSSSGIDAESEVKAPYRLSSQSSCSLYSSTSSTSSSSSAYYSPVDLKITEDERIYLKKFYENLFSLYNKSPLFLETDYVGFEYTCDKMTNPNAFFQANSAESLRKDLVIFTKLPDCIQIHILSSLHKIYKLRELISSCECEHEVTLKKILALDRVFGQTTIDPDVDSSIQSASLPFLNAQTHPLPKPQLNAKTLKQALILFEISEPYSNSIDSLMDEDTQDRTADEENQEDAFQANVMILIKNLGQASTTLLVKLYQNFPRQMENLRALLQKQYDALILDKKSVRSKQKNKKSKHTDKTAENQKNNLENITLCGQDFAIALQTYLSKNDSRNLTMAIKSFSENILSLSERRYSREMRATNNRNYCFSPCEDKNNFSKAKYCISPDIMSLIRSGAPNMTIEYGSLDKRNTSVFLPSKARAAEISDITPSIYLRMLFHSQIHYNFLLSESLVYKTLKELGYGGSKKPNHHYPGLCEPNPIACKPIHTVYFKIGIHRSGKILIQTTPEDHKKIDDDESLPETPIHKLKPLHRHIEKTMEFCKSLRKKFQKYAVPVEIIEANLSKDHWEALFVSSYTLRYDIYHEFCRGIEKVKKIGESSFPYQFGEIRKINTKLPERTGKRYKSIRTISEIIKLYDLDQSPIKSWTFYNLTHTNKSYSNHDQAFHILRKDVSDARRMKIFSQFNVHQLPIDENFFFRLAPLKFLERLIFTHKEARLWVSKCSYLFANEAFKALLKLPKLPALKSVSLTSGEKAINLRQYRNEVTCMSESLNEYETNIADSKKQIKLAKSRLGKINKELGQTQDSSKSSQLNKELSAIKSQLETSSSEITEKRSKCRSLRSKKKTLTQGTKFIKEKTEQCVDDAIPILNRSSNKHASSSDSSQEPSHEDRYPKLEEIILDEVTFTKEKGKWSTPGIA